MNYPKEGMKVKLSSGLRARVRRVLPMALYLHGYKRPVHHGEWTFESIKDRHECKDRVLITCKVCHKLIITENDLEVAYHMCPKCFGDFSQWRIVR